MIWLNAAVASTRIRNPYPYVQLFNLLFCSRCFSVYLSNGRCSEGAIKTLHFVAKLMVLKIELYTGGVDLRVCVICAPIILTLSNLKHDRWTKSHDSLSHLMVIKTLSSYSRNPKETSVFKQRQSTNICP